MVIRVQHALYDNGYKRGGGLWDGGGRGLSDERDKNDLDRDGSDGGVTDGDMRCGDLGGREARVFLPRKSTGRQEKYA